MNLVSLRWFYDLHVPPPQLEQLILKLDFLPPAKPPDHSSRIKDDKFMVLRDQLLTLVLAIEARLQVTEVVCKGLQQVLFLKQLDCTQPNNVRSRSSTKYFTVQVIHLVDIAVTVDHHSVIEEYMWSMLAQESLKELGGTGLPSLGHISVIASKPVLIFIYLEVKINFKGVGNDIIHVVLGQCLLTSMLYNEKTIGDIK
ncbi:hypothetical protein A2U01_0014277, partial [Trifolium medium]|nr:hypothetical protein [Trifolium medium]